MSRTAYTFRTTKPWSSSEPVRQPTIAPTRLLHDDLLRDSTIVYLLPPFFPVERNSDGIFGVMVRRGDRRQPRRVPALVCSSIRRRGIGAFRRAMKRGRSRNESGIADVLIASDPGPRCRPPLTAGPGASTTASRKVPSGTVCR